MRPEQIRGNGTALAERVRTQVDTRERLELMLNARRRGRIVAIASAGIAILALVVGAYLLARLDEPTVVTAPPTTAPAPGLQSLPVEVFVVLEGDYAVTDDGACEGSGPLAGISEGSALLVLEETGVTTDEIARVTLPLGEEVTASDERAAFLPMAGQPAVCVFTLNDLGYDIRDYNRITLETAVTPETGSGMSISGQRVFVTLEAIPEEIP